MEDKAEIKKILIVAPNWIGDAVLSLPALIQIRESFPSSYITIIGLPHIGELFKESPFIDDIKIYNNAVAVGFSLRPEKYELAILFPNSFRSALMARLAGIPLRCGYNRDGRGFLLNMPVNTEKGSACIERSENSACIFRFAQRRRCERSEKRSRIHQAEYYLNIVKSLEARVIPLNPHLEKGNLIPPFIKRGMRGLYISQDESDQALETLHKNNITPDNLIVGINPGATYGSSKRWYPERFGQVARNLIQRYNARVIVFGSKREIDIAEEIIRSAGLPLFNMTGKTSIRELMAIISHCKLFITNDSGPMHIAAALGVPVVAIFGSTDPLLTGPLGERHIVIKKDVSCSPCFLRKCPTDLKCMDLISADDVLAGVGKIFG